MLHNPLIDIAKIRFLSVISKYIWKYYNIIMYFNIRNQRELEKAEKRRGCREKYAKKMSFF